MSKFFSSQQSSISNCGFFCLARLLLWLS